ncbi:MAG: PAS domain-containing protein, partial [Thermodesulfovibrionales bacterium]
MDEERKTGEQLINKLAVPPRSSADSEAPLPERSLGEERILYAKQELELIIDTMTDLVAMVDNRHRLLRVNKALAGKFRVSPKELVGKLCNNYICNSGEPFRGCLHAQVMADGQERAAEMYLAHLGGYYLVTVTPIRDNMGRVTGTVHIARDITKRKRAEEAVRKSEDKFRSLTESSSDWIWEVDAEFRYTYSSPKVKQILGYEPEEMIGRALFDLMPEKEVRMIQNEVTTSFRENRHLERLEHVNLAMDGRLVTLETSAVPFFDASGIFLGYRGIDRDITERKHAEKQLASVNAFLQSVIDGVADLIMVFDKDYRVKLMNKAAREFSLGDRPMTESLFCYELFHRGRASCSKIGMNCPHAVIFETGQPVTVNHTHIDKDGQEKAFEIHASPIFDETGKVAEVVEVCRDVTKKMVLEEERKKIEARLYREQKEESILTLAGGIAHDFNNLLMAVLGNAEMLQMGFQPSMKGYIFTENIVNASKRMADLTNQLLAYAKSSMRQPETISLNDSVKEALNLTHKGKANEIEVALDLSEELVPVFADPAQMVQVFVNVFANAFEAMEKNGGCLSVRSENTVKEKPWECQRFNHVHPEGQYVYIRIADTGPGIPEDLQGRIFEPFVTTKFLGRGLGLPAAAGILENNSGCISVESYHGKGTILHVYLPAVKPARGEERVQQKQRAKVLDEKVLVVEDDPQILLLLIAMLTKMGHTVLSAVNGNEGLDIFRRQRNAIKIVILDIQLPDMN